MNTKFSISFVMQCMLLVCCVAHGELANNPPESTRCNDWVPITVMSTAGDIYSSSRLMNSLTTSWSSALRGVPIPMPLRKG